MFKNDLVMVAGEDSGLPPSTALIRASRWTTWPPAITPWLWAMPVPAGNYTNQALSTVGCFIDADGKTGKDSAGTGWAYDGTPLEGKVNLQSSVGNVCKQAQSGAVDVAFVYSSDVYRFGGVKVIGVVPDDTHKNIIYPAAICKDSTQAEAANEFIEWATTNADAKKLWQEWGFELVS